MSTLSYGTIVSDPLDAASFAADDDDYNEKVNSKEKAIKPLSYLDTLFVRKEQQLLFAVWLLGPFFCFVSSCDHLKEYKEI